MTRMTLAELEALLDRHGSEPHGWPRGSADRVAELCARDPEAQALLETVRALDHELAAVAAAKPADSAMIGRVLASVRERRASDSFSLWLTPVRMAAFAGAAVLCMALGATLGLMIDQSGQSTAQLQGDEVASLVLGVGDDWTFGTGESL